MRQRQPRKHDEAHRKFIGTLPCLICGDATSTECAHISFADLMIAKPFTAMASKADDIFTVPLCNKHHREQHESNERQWWTEQGLDPVKIALALYVASGDYMRAEQIVTRVAA